MKTAGIIAEYNPFHNGHKYHMEETRRKTGADYVITVISGDFVQRGAPALINKFERTKMALENGADLVIELPVTTALSSAEGFASGGVCLLDRLGVVTDLSFGAEVSAPEDIDILYTSAKLSALESLDFQNKLSDYLKQGYSFPAAKAKAIQEYPELSYNPKENISSLLSSPNNILAMEYLKAVQKYQCRLIPCIISRMGGGYHDQRLNKDLASASAIRHFLLRDRKENDGQAPAGGWSLLSDHVPLTVYQSLIHASDHHFLLQENDFSDMLFYALNEHAREMSQYGSANTDLALRAGNMLEHFESWTQFVTLLKSKNQTYTAISRYLAHILLGLRREYMILAAQSDYAPYARILGFKKSSAPLLKEIQKKSRIPVIGRLAKDRRTLSEKQNILLDLDIYASSLYNRILYSGSGRKLLSDYRQPLICL